MSKITLTNLVNLQNETTAVNAINDNSAVIQTAFDNTLSRDGTSPNQMSAPLDMNSNSILNVPNPIRAGDAVNFQTISTLTGGGTVSNLPTGGTQGQVLTKKSATNFDSSWQNTNSALSGAATIRANPTNSSALDTDVTIQGLVSSISPDATSDRLLIFDNASGTLKGVQPSLIATSAVAGVSSIAGNSGVFTLGTGLTNSVNTLLNTGVVSVHLQTFTSSGTYTPSTGMIYAIIEAVGAGGGGGAAFGTVGGLFTGGGGGSGAYTRATATATDIGTSKAIVIGAGGSGGTISVNATSGTSTTVGSTLVTAPGGVGALSSASSVVPLAGAGGAAGSSSLAFFTIPGNAGQTGIYNTQGIFPVLSMGAGAPSYFGASTGGNLNVSTGTVTPGVSATANTGTGGQGGCAFADAVVTNGGAGASGIVIITEFCKQ